MYILCPTILINLISHSWKEPNIIIFIFMNLFFCVCAYNLFIIVSFLLSFKAQFIRHRTVLRSLKNRCLIFLLKDWIFLNDVIFPIYRPFLILFSLLEIFHMKFWLINIFLPFFITLNSIATISLSRVIYIHTCIVV